MNMVKSIIKAFDILELIAHANGSSNLVKITGQLGINRTTAYHIVQTLLAKGYITRVEGTNSYEIGMKCLPLAARLLDNNKLRIESLPYLQELAQKSGERINLGVLHQGEVLYLAGVEKPSLPLVYTRFGRMAPAHCCSLGKIILANMPEEEVDRLLDEKPLVKLTENTITDPLLFKKHLAEIRSQGYAIDHAEHLPGSYCISSLIRDVTGKGIGSISISSGELEKIKNHLDHLLQTAEIISHKMGYTLR